MFGGIRGIHIPHDPFDLGSGFSLTKPNELLLSARSTIIMSQDECREGERVSAYLLYKTKQPAMRDESRDQSIEEFQHGLMALQIIKPVQTLGFMFQGTKYESTFGLERTIHRPPTDAGRWARMRLLDKPLLTQVCDLIPRVFKVMKGTNAEDKNSIILLQLALEDPHPLLTGLLAVMAMEARFDSHDRFDFEKKLCTCLGPSTRAFADWNSPAFPQPKETVKDLAIPIYMLRSKLAHGRDLRSAIRDPRTPVDLRKNVALTPELGGVPNAYILAEAAIYIHCQVLVKCL